MAEILLNEKYEKANWLRTKENPHKYRHSLIGYTATC